MSSIISTDEKKWREEDDARTLTQAEIIKSDKERLKGAISAADRMASEKQDEVNFMRKVAGKKVIPTKNGTTKNEVVINNSGNLSSANKFNVFKKI